VLITFAVVPFGDVLVVGGREINLQAASLNIGILYVLAMVSLACTASSSRAGPRTTAGRSSAASAARRR
jgi:hypothetical protein